MSATATPKAPSATQSSARVSLDAFEILHVIHDTRSMERRAALRAKWVWIGATLVGALVCWQIVADKFALSREVDKYFSLMAIQSALQNGVINHATNIASEAAVLTVGLLIALVWWCSLGVLALVSALYGVLPRIYLGLHYFSDVAAGALLGVVFVLLFERFGPRALADRGVDWERRLLGLFYGVAFLACFEVATLFEDIRQVGRGIPAVLKQLGIGVAF